MANNIVAYVGIESFDTILYLSRIMQKLGRRVLVVDNSDTFALTLSVPRIAEINTYETTICYRRVDFTNIPVSNELAAEYDDVLIDCGMKVPVTSILLFTKIIYVTDQFQYNIRRIANIDDYDCCKCEKLLLIRNAVYTKISADKISQQINKAVSLEKTRVLYLDESDYERCLNSHINQVFTLNLSKLYKEYLIDQVKSMCSNFTRKEIKEAYRKAKNGD
jgi:hypothetical protein